MDSPAMPLTEVNLKILRDDYHRSGGTSWWTHAVESWSEGYMSNEDDGEETSSSQETTSDSQTLPNESPGSSDGEMVERNHMALVTVPQPGPVKHQSAASESQHLMSGRLFAECGGFIFIPSAASETQWHMKGETPTVPFFDVGARTKEDLEEARRFLKHAGSGIPKFLFRGFSHESGGGVDSRLNTRDGVVPHAFLRVNNRFQTGDKLKSMWEIPVHDLCEMITGHIQHDARVETAFSSWTHTLKTALGFALMDDSSMIAVLDTTHESMADRVWYTEDLLAAGLTKAAYADEFLVYGPVSGPNYHCISVQELMDTTRVLDIMYAPYPVFGNDGIGLIEREAVEASKQIATALQPLGTSSENIMILTARFVGLRMDRFLAAGEHMSYHDLHAFLHYVQDDLRSLARRPDARTISLADQTMDTCFSKALDTEIQMLQAAQNAVHLLGWGLQPAWLNMFNNTDQDQLEDVTDEMELEDETDEMELEDVTDLMELD